MAKSKNAQAAMAAVTKSLHANLKLGDAQQNETMRSTFSAPPEVIIQLRTLALQHRCTMNDLLLIGIDDLLRAAGKTCPMVVKENIRAQLKRQAEQT
jgi:hypothetical protein